MNKKNFSDLIEDQFKDISLPTDEEIRKDTLKTRQSTIKKLWWNHTAEGKLEKRKLIERIKQPENLKKLIERNRERGFPFKIIFPDGKEKFFKGHFEAKEYFGNEWNTAILPTVGAKRIQRKKYKNCIVHRTDVLVDKEFLEKLKKEVEIRVNPPRIPRDHKLWAKKMKKWRDSKEGKVVMKKRNDKMKRIMLKAKPGQSVITPLGEFKNWKIAASAHKIKPMTLRNRMRDASRFYYFKHKGPGLLPKPRLKNIHTPYGEFFSAVDAHAHAKKIKIDSALKANSPQYWFNEQCKKDPKNYFIK